MFCTCALRVTCPHYDMAQYFKKQFCVGRKLAVSLSNNRSVPLEESDDLSEGNKVMSFLHLTHCLTELNGTS